jgi:hypothetical protein
MAAEEAGVSLLDEVREDSRRKGSCSVCDWIAARDDADEWDAVMALPSKDANNKAVYRAMAKRGYQRGDKTVEDHRKKGHRVPA